PGLSGDLLIEKTRAVREGHAQLERASGTIARNGSLPVHLEVEVSPLVDSAGERLGLVYMAHDVTAFRAMEVELRKANDERLSALEEMQTANEEMQSCDEEMQPRNTELHSGNEAGQ